MKKKKIIYTDSAQKRLEKLNQEMIEEIEKYFMDTRNIPGDDFIEITASDIEEVSHRIKLIRPSSKKRLSLKYFSFLYFISGIIISFIGIFWNELVILLKESPQRFAVISLGILMVFVGSVVYFVIKNREEREKEFLEKEREREFLEEDYEDFLERKKFIEQVQNRADFWQKMNSLQ